MILQLCYIFDIFVTVIKMNEDPDFYSTRIGYFDSGLD